MSMALPYLLRKKKEKLDSSSEFGPRILTLLQHKRRSMTIKGVGTDKTKKKNFTWGTAHCTFNYE